MFVRRILAVTAATIATTALVSTLPASAATHSGGSVTVKEGRKVVRQADNQRCLTVKETRKIVHGKGILVGKDKDSTYLTWTGKGHAEYLDVVFYHGCADAVWFARDNGKTLVFLDERSPLFSEA